MAVINSKQKLSEEYWLNRLSGHLAKVSLPFTNNVKSSNRVKERFIREIPEDIQTELIKLSRSSDVGLFILFFTGLNLSLYKYTEMDDIVVGTTALIKDGSELLCCRNRVESELTLKEYLNSTKGSVLKDLSYGEYVFKNMFEKLKVNSNQSSVDIFNVGFIYDRIQTRPDIFEEFKLVIVLSEEENRLRLVVEYNVELYDRGFVESFVANYLLFFSDIRDKLEKKINDLEIISSEEKQKVLVDFNNSTSPFPDDKTLTQLFEEQVQRTPDEVAVAFGEQRVTYQQLNELANRVARVLRRKGVKQNQIIGIMTEISIEMVVGILGILKAGGAYLPIDPEFPEERISYLIEDSQTEVILTQDYLIDQIKGDVEIIDLAGEEVVDEVTDDLPVLAKYADLAYVIYTSGSTGKAKGVMIQHNSIINQLTGLAEMFSLDGTYNHILMAPFTFDASVKHIFLSLISQGKLHLVPKKLRSNVPYLLDYFIENQINIMNVVPSLLNTILDYVGSEHKIYFKCIMLAGEVFTKNLYTKLVERVRVDHVFNIYGPTEATINATYYECHDKLQNTIPIGKPLPNYRLYIVDEQLNPVPIGVPGELCIAGVSIARGYLNRPELTGDRFVSNGVNGERVYRTGDLAYWLPDGNIEFIGRRDHQVKIRGCRIELSEIENHLLEHTGVKDVVVVDKQVSQEDKVLCAYLVSEGQSLTAEEMRSYLTDKLPSYMIPAYFVNLEKMPVTHNGKVDRKYLQDMEISLKETKYVAPENEMEEKMQKIWQKIFRQDQISIHDNFTDLGGTSIEVIRVIGEIQKAFDIRLDVSEVFDTPSIHQLVELIMSKNATSGNEIQPIAEQEYYTVTPAQTRMWIMDQLKSNDESFNICTAYQVEGQVNLEALEAAVLELVQRHESLRTTFADFDGVLKQKVHDEIQVSIQYHDYRLLDDKREKTCVFIRKEDRRSFDLENGPLFRVNVIHYEDEGYVFVLTIHHIVSDAWSMLVLFRDLLVLYSAHAEGVENILTNLRIQYKDYAAWIDELLSEKNVANMEKYWLEQFSEEIPLVDIPSDLPRPEFRSGVGALVTFTIGKELAMKIKEMSKSRNVTSFTILLTSVYIFLYHYTKERDLVIGTLSAGRDGKDLEEIIGFFINTLFLRVKLEAEESFNELLSRVKKVTIDAFENQHYSIDNIVEHLNLQRVSGRSPFSDIGFSYLNRNCYDDFTDLADLSYARFDVDSEEGERLNVDLAFEFQEDAEDIVIILKYNTDLFYRTRIEVMQEKYLLLLEEMLKNPTQAISELNFVTLREKGMIKVMDVDFELDF